MKSTLKYIILSSIMIILGVLYAAYAYNLIIIRLPYSSSTPHTEHTSLITTSKRKIPLFFWHNDTWNKEETELIWSTNSQKNLHYVIDSWLTLLEEENIQEKRIALQSVAIYNNQAYISFDRNPFDKEMATIEKLLWIEGLLKTVRHNNADIQTIQFLVHHKVLHDYHLDFSNPWPIEGFFSLDNNSSIQ